MKKYLAFVVLGLMATAAFAGTATTNTNTVSPTLQVQATVQSAIRLTLSTGTAAIASHCTINPGAGTDYSVNFGTVDALAINAPSCGSVIAPAVPGTSDAIYWSDYNLTPVYTGQAATTNKITAVVSANFTASDISVVRDNANSATVPTVATDFTPVSTGTPDQIATNVTNGTAITRFIGVAVHPTNGAGTLTGVQNATVTFTLTVQ